MLETTSFYMQACRLLYSAASGAFILSAVSAGVYYLRFKEPSSSRHFGLCLMSLLYIVGCTIYTFDSPPSELNRILLPFLYIIGSSLYLNYVKMVTQLIQIQPPWLQVLSLPVRVLPYLMILDITLHLTIKYDLFFSSLKDHRISNWFMQIVTENITQKTTIFLVLFPAALSVFVVNTLLCVIYRKQLQKQVFLFLGMIFTFIAVSNDIALTLFDPPYLFPMAFGGFLFEIVRFNVSLIENQQQDNNKMKNYLKDSLSNLSHVRLSKQILHDVKSIRRNLIFTLTQKKDLSQFSQSLENEINRLAIYDKVDLNSSAEPISLKETCLSSVKLFEKELQLQRCEVKMEVEDDLRVSANRNDILIALSNLIQNSLEAQLESDSPKWISFEAAKDRGIVVLSVSDSGKIAPADALKIFRSGFSKKGSQRGFGLNIAQEALAANSALISLQNDRPHTTFKIEFLGVEES